LLKKKKKSQEDKQVG